MSSDLARSARKLSLLVLTPGVLALAACSQQPSSEVPSGTPTADETAAVAEAVPAPEPTPAPASVILAGTGLEARYHGTSKRLSFGSDQYAVIGAVAAATGLTPKVSQNVECGAGAMAFTTFGDLTLDFQDGKFVGWLADAGTGAVAVTVDGVRSGTHLAELRHERDVKLLADSTLDGEFTYVLPSGGEIGGFVEGEGEAAKVRSLFAGAQCFFR